MRNLNDVNVTTVNLNCFEDELDSLSKVISNYMHIVKSLDEKLIYVKLAISNFKLDNFLHAKIRFIEFAITKNSVCSSDSSKVLRSEHSILNALTINRN